MASSSSEVSRFFKHSTIYTVGNILNRVGAFILLPLYTRYLTPTEYGTLELFYVFSAIFSGILSVGIAHATLRFYFDYKEQSDRNSVVSTNLMASFVISAAGAALAWAFTEPLVKIVLGTQPPRFAFDLILATLVLELSTQVCLAYLRALERSILFVAVVLGKLVVQCVANTVLVMHYEAGVDGVLAGNGLAVLSGWLFLVIFTLRHVGLRFETAKLMPVLRYSLPFLYTTIVSVVVANLDRFLITKLLSLEALGIYALASKFAKLISDLIGEPFARAYGSFRYTIMKRPDAAQIQVRVVRIVCCLLAFVCLGLIFFTGDVLHLMSDAKFWPAAQLMPVLAVAASISTISYAFQTGILFKKNTGDLFRVSMKQNALGVLASLTLMPLFGVNGAVASVLIQAVAGAWLTHRASQRYFPVEYETRRLLALCGCGLSVYLLSIPLQWAPAAVAFATKLVLLAVFVWLLLRFDVVTEEERAVLREKGSGLILRWRGSH